jgi:ribose transport system substrate-binding protein
MQLKRIVPLTGAVIAAALTVAAATTSALGAPKHTAKSAACALASAKDPGNSVAPASIPVAKNAPKLAKKSHYTVAFSQNASNNPWRLAETASMKAEAKKLGDKITVTDANNSQSKQIADIKSLIAQHPDALFIAPITEQLAGVIKQAGAAGIPVFLLDRDVNHAVAKPGKDYVTVIESDFVQEGKRAAVAMAHATGGNAKILELLGTTGASPAIDRRKGFETAIKACSGMKIIDAQDGDFNRATGQKVAATMLQAHPDATAIYAHNDEMALGAIAALKALGKVPGKDVKVVSIDGEKEAIQNIISGAEYTSVQCNPHFGPEAFATMMAYASGKPVKTQIINKDLIFTPSNAKANLVNGF